MAGQLESLQKINIVSNGVLSSSKARVSKDFNLFYVYIIECGDGSYYGHTEDIQARFHMHESGNGAAYTKLMQPLKLVYSEKHESKTFAVKRENQIKKWSHEKKEALISGDLAKLKHLSRKIFHKQ